MVLIAAASLVCTITGLTTAVCGMCDIADALVNKMMKGNK